MRRLLRVAGSVLIVGGIAILVWAAAVWRWQDPFTGLYTRYEQHKLAARYDEHATRFAADHLTTPSTGHRSLAETRREIHIEAQRYRLEGKRGEPIARIRAPRLSLNMILVNGTDHDSLKSGPGRDLRTFMPGEGQLVYIAGHRTTYLAPFSDIDELRRGDPVWLSLPYATFEYTITGHTIVPAGDLAVLRSHGHEQLVLQACHPRFFASHRYLAYGKLVRIVPLSGPSLALASAAVLAARYPSRR